MDHSFTIRAFLGGITAVLGFMLFLLGLIGVLASGHADAPQAGDSLARDSAKPLFGGLAMVLFGMWMLS